MKYFIDTEFIESGPYKPVQLISLGIVCEDGREYYAQSTEFCAEDANDWVHANVLSKMDPLGDYLSIKQIASQVLQFVNTCNVNSVGVAEKPEFWGYCCDYDWVVFCQVFGTMMDLPKGWPMYCRDIKQWCDDLGNPRLPSQDSAEHHAINDARWNMKAWQFLNGIAR